MAPKKPGKDFTDENSWRTAIEAAPLDEEYWKVKVVVIEAAGSDQDRIYLNKFEIFAAEEKRFVIKNICKTETIFMVNQLGGEKKVKDDNLRVFEEGQAYLKDKKDIPPDILALIIKHLILKMKVEYLFIKKQRLEVKQGMKRESLTIIDRTEVRGTVCVKPPEPEEPPPPPPKGKGKKEEPDQLILLPEPAEGKKYNTLLRVRGEEWRDKVYVDDFPTDGPNLYVAVTGFVEPLLCGCLLKIGIPLTALVQVRIDPSTTNIPSTLLRGTKRGQSQTEILTDKSLKFWEDLQLLRINKDTADDFNNTAFVVFSPPYWDSENLSGDPDKIYDELCYLMYDVHDLTRQHLHYLDNMDIINIPEDFSDKRLNSYYNHQIIDLPLECVTMYSVLDGILQTVCRSQELEEQSSRTSLSTAITINQPRKSLADQEKTEKAETLVKEVFGALCKTDANKKAYRQTYGEEYEAHKDPIVISYGDFAKYNTFHLDNINLENIVGSSLHCMPINKLWEQQHRPHGELEAKINFHVNVLLSCFEREDVETAELRRLIHILSCRKLFNNRSSLKKRHLQSTTITDFKKIYLKRSVLAEPLPKCPSLLRSSSSVVPSFPSMTKSENISDSSLEEDPETRRINFLFDCPDISELVSAAEIANERPLNHLIDDFEYFEDFSGISGYQIMFDAFNKFNCVDYKYCEVTDCFVLMFFNSHDHDGIAREEWRCHLSTPLCLQDFFDFVLEENYDWIQNEEKIYDEHVVIKSQSLYKDLIDPLAIKSCVENSEVDLELLMEGSLKYQVISEMEEVVSEETDAKVLSSKKMTVSPSMTEVDSKSSKKTKTTAASTPKKIRQSFMATGGDTSSCIFIPRKPFFGYDLGDRRVEVFGKDAKFFSKDGTRVTSMYTLIIPMNVEFIALEVVPGNSYNEFWLHRALGEGVSKEILDSCESFRINSKDQIMINIKKQTYKVPVPIMPVSSMEFSKRKESLTGKQSTKVPNIFESKHFHSLSITWPNGLLTESVHENNSPEISHIKQFHVFPVPNFDEVMRCISLNGEVVVFRINGDVEVLKPDGTYIKITKYGKRLVVPEVQEETASEISSDKTKKGKGKEKLMKSSKNILVEDDKLSEEQQSEYELIIEEFEIVETSGLRQQWINDDSIDIEKLLIRTAKDYCIGEVFSRRIDGTNILINKDGVQVVTFPNKTRIITHYIVEDDEIYPEWTEEEKEFFDMLDSDVIDTDTTKSMSQKSNIGTYSASLASYSSKKMNIEVDGENEKQRTDGYISVQIEFTIEHANFTTVNINKANGKISVESPNGSIVVVDTENEYDITLDSLTKAKFNGENLHVIYEACPECQSFTKCDIKIKSDDMSSVTKIHQNWMKMKDSFSKRILVNEEGSISFTDEPCSEDPLEEATAPEETIEVADDKPADGKSQSSVMSHGKCREIYLAKTVRFFVLGR